ncbi:MAG: hypothetical protein AAF434_17625 [Pseudomonadota bacterium]
MKIAILDVVPEVYWREDKGRNDGVKFESLLREQLPDADLHVFSVTCNEWPDSPEKYDGYLLSGSPCSASNHYTWTSRLAALVGQIIDRKQRLIGVCFGHQFIAQQLGGGVERLETGWMIGLRDLHVRNHQPWMTPAESHTKLHYFNQDHVCRLPENATALGSETDCPFAAYAVSNHIFCLQAHPEQKRDSMQNFIGVSRGAIHNDVLDKALESMQNADPDAALWGQWMSQFYTQ